MTHHTNDPAYEKRIQDAIASIANGFSMSVRAAAESHDVSRTTLQARINRRQATTKRPESQLLSLIEEDALVDYINQLYDWGVSMCL